MGEKGGSREKRWQRASGKTPQCVTIDKGRGGT